jgi:hypothetical protein
LELDNDASNRITMHCGIVVENMMVEGLHMKLYLGEGTYNNTASELR